MANITMHPRNAVSAKLAECYVTIRDEEHPEGQRYNFMSAINVNVNFEKTKQEIPILGRSNKGHKSTGSNITGSAEFHFNTAIWRKLAKRFQDSGEDVYFDMQITNDDPTAADVGRQTIILYDCNWDSITLAAFDADSDDVLKESIDFTAERFEMPEEFKVMAGMI